MLSAPLPRPANGERIEVRGIRKRLFRRRANSYESIVVDRARLLRKKATQPEQFFGDTYGTEISQATNFAGSIRSKITSWISIAPEREPMARNTLSSPANRMIPKSQQRLSRDRNAELVRSGVLPITFNYRHAAANSIAQAQLDEEIKTESSNWI